MLNKCPQFPGFKAVCVVRTIARVFAQQQHENKFYGRARMKKTAKMLLDIFPSGKNTCSRILGFILLFYLVVFYKLLYLMTSTDGFCLDVPVLCNSTHTHLSITLFALVAPVSTFSS